MYKKQLFIIQQLCLSGSSGVGKSVLTTEILNNFDKCTDSKIKSPTYVYCYKSRLPDDLQKSSNSYVYQGIPNLKNLRLKLADGKSPLVLVFDDLLSGEYYNHYCILKPLFLFLPFFLFPTPPSYSSFQTKKKKREREIKYNFFKKPKSVNLLFFFIQIS